MAMCPRLPYCSPELKIFELYTRACIPSTLFLDTMKFSIALHMRPTVSLR